MKIIKITLKNIKHTEKQNKYQKSKNVGWGRLGKTPRYLICLITWSGSKLRIMFRLNPFLYYWLICVCSWLVYVKWPGVIEGHPKTGKLEWSFSYLRRETGRNELIPTEKFLSLPPCKSVNQVPWTKMLRNNWTKAGVLPSAVFVRAIALQTKISRSRKSLRNLGSMPMMFARFVYLKNQSTGSLKEKLVECCGITVLTTACWWPSNHSIPA